MVAAKPMRLSTPALILLLLLGFACAVWADDEYQRVQVADPFLELHTAAGRGYPVFYVVERGEWVQILSRKTDWFKVRTPRGKAGWVNRAQLERTLTQGEVEKTFRDVLVGDFLERKLEFGVAGGVFDGEPVVTTRAGYRFTRNLALELSVGQIAGTFSNSLYYQANLVSMPFPQWRISPFFTLGIGRFNNKARPTLVDDEQTDSTTANVGLGLRAYITRNFMARFDFKDYLSLVDDNQDEEFQEYTLGASFFF